MQNRKALKVLIAVISIVCLYELSFTYFANSYESSAEGETEEEKQEWIKANATDELWMGYNYLEVKKREINLGLDLRGGVSVTLEIAVNELVRSLAGTDAATPKYKAVEKRAIELKKTQPGGYLGLFKQAYDAEMNGIPMVKWFAGQEGLTNQSTDDEVMAKLTEAAEGAIGQARQVLRTRVKQFGVAQPDIKMVGSTGRIIVDLPGVKDIKRVRSLLQGSANLEMWDTYYVTDFPTNAIDNEIKLRNAAKAAKDTTVVDSSEVAFQSSEDSIRDVIKKDFPFSALFQGGPSNDQGNVILGIVSQNDTAKVNEYIRIAKAKKIIRPNVVPSWSNELPGDNAGYYHLYLLAAERSGKAFMEGEFITNAKSDIRDGQDMVLLDFRSNASLKWEEITTKSFQQNGKPIAIVLDGVVYSAPGAHNGPIKNGGTQITMGGGDNTAQEAKDLANVLNAGKFPAPAKIVQETFVGPTLGASAISAATWSFAIALLLVLAYMIFYYSTAGIVANIALIANMGLIVGVLASFPTISLTLPGVAGIVLTIGMSVDANVLIYERIREELRTGKGIKLAIADGYKHAYTAILDANLTTLITGIILWYFGTSVIESFAQTLVAGILTSLFSAIFISRLVFESMLKRGKEIKFSSKTTENWFANAKYNVISSRKKFYVISAIVIIAGIASFSSRGFDLGTDFSGGRTFTVGFAEEVDVDEVKATLNGVFVIDGKEYNPEVKTADGSRKLMITTKFLADDESKDASAKVESFLFAGLKKYMPAGMTAESFVELGEGNDVGVLQIDHVQSTIADDIIEASYSAVLVALFAIFLYVAVRFRQWQFGVGALIAIFHDVLVVLAVFSIFHGILPFSLEISTSFVAAILTVVGYSINDTVVVFDRIRERLLGQKSEALPVVVNKALNSTLSRTFNTSITIVVVLVAIMLFGTGSLQGFAFALLVGVVVGTYSSICIATPIYVDLVKKDKEAE